MHKNLFRIFFLIVFFSLGSCGNGNDPTRKVRIGIVNLTPTVETTIQGFKEGLAELGYEEGKNVEYLYEGPVKKIAALDGAIERVLNQKPDLILSLLTPVTVKLKHATAESKIPVVFGPVGDPLSAGIVKSFKEPGNNLTGVRVAGTEEKALEWFKRIVPNLDTLLVPYNPNETAMTIALESLKKAAEKMEIHLIIPEVRKKNDLKEAFTRIPAEVDGVWTLGSGFWAPFVDDYIEATLNNRLPFKGTTAEWCKRGALFSFSEDLHQLGKQQARMAAAILSGASPETLPVEQADFFLTVNPNTARAIQLDISDTLLKQVDFIVNSGE